MQTEWCYNYHDAERSYECNTAKYPTPDEQRRFLKSYIQHRPFIASSPSLIPGTPQTGSVNSFVLDSRAPPSSYLEEESVRKHAVEDEVDRLVHETRIWRMANSAQWVAWGIVQAKVPGLDEALKSRYQPATPSSLLLQRGTSAASETTSSNVGPRKEKGENGDEQEEEEESDDDGEFDYLAYAQDRAMFFWADALQLGIVKREDLPTPLLERVKIVEY